MFTSPSAAGAIVSGWVSANGRTLWKTETRQTLGDWEEGQETTTTAGRRHQP
ncbi:DUF4357 domain-containing protein [Corynebacterium sp. 11A]|uniref:DUF4357 domain-containing protein n=1 Tax=Corynebacterium sp. 11A TaxID=2080510 RepID=UPI00124DDD5C|nr:DUF4357 domain-containing protein [Corynebacterium sp. 11A]